MTAAGWRWPAERSLNALEPQRWTPLAAPPRSTAGRNDFCRTALPRSATCLPKRSPLSVSPPCTPAPTTPAATARSNGSIKPRNAGCGPDPKPPRSLSSRPGSTSSVISTTTNGHIAPSIDASRPTSGQRPPRADQRTTRSAELQRPTTTSSTPATSVLATASRSPSDAATRANQHSSSPPTPTATSSSMADSPADSPSTPPNASNPSTPNQPPPRGKTRDMRERCPATQQGRNGPLNTHRCGLDGREQIEEALGDGVVAVDAQVADRFGVAERA